MNVNYNWWNSNRISSQKNVRVDKKSSLNWFGSFVLFLSLMIGQFGMAQVSNYTFAQSTGTYAAITGGTLHGSADNAAYSFALPFTFTYNGTGYTAAKPTTNGFLILGGNTPSVSEYNPISSSAGGVNFAISGFGADLFSTVRSEVLGTSPNRIYVCQWSGAGRYSSGLQSDAMNFQIRLYETTNAVEIVYGTNNGTATSSTVQVGIKGASNADFNNRTSTANWASTNAGTVNTSSVTYSSSIKPASGLTLTWSPLVLSPCVAPTASPTALVFGTTTTTAIAGSFTAASPAASKYLVVRSDSATPPTPVNGTAYTVGSTALGAGTNVRQVSNAVTFSDSGLTAGTQYYYHIFSYNDACIGEPFYRTVALSGTQNTLCATGTTLGSNTITTTSANITWTGSGNYIVEYGVTGFTAGTGATAGAGGTIASSSATSPFALTGLSSSTTYQVYVRQVCPLGGFSANSTATSFSTLCAPFSAPTTVEPFTSAVPPTTCWSRNNGLLAASTTLTASTAWILGDFGNVTSPVNKSAKINIFGSSRKDWLITPSYDLGTSGGFQLKFNLALTTWNATTANTLGVDDKFAVVISTDNGVTWSNANVLQQWTSATPIPNGAGVPVTISLASYTGTVKIGFYGESTVSNADNDLFVDNVVISALPVLPPDCATGHAPADLATGFNRNGTLTWAAATGSPASYDVYFGTTASPSLVTNTTGLSYTPPTMAGTTTYYWKIVPKNGNGDATGCLERSFTTAAGFTYCTSTYSSGGTSDAITNVTLGSLSNTTPGNAAAAPYYTYFDALVVPDIQQGGTAAVSVSFGSDGNQWAGAWIDFNQNGLFDTSEGVVSTVNAGASGTTVLNFNVPVGAVLGNTRLRVRGGNDSALTTAQACTTFTWGETEDYIVNVIAQPTDTPDYVNLQSPASATVLAGDSATVFAQVYEAGLTNVEPGYSGQAAGIEAWIGISPIGADASSNPNTWTTWVLASHNAGHVSNNDEYQANIGATLAVGTYRYASRFRLNGGPFVYGGNPFNAWNGTDSNSGVLTVNANPTQCAGLVAPAAAATNVPRGTIALSWTAPASGPAPTGYKVYFGTTSGSLALMTTTSAATFTYNASAPAYSTVYYWRITPTSTIGGDAVGCVERSFTTEADPFAPYCSGVTYTSTVEPITNVNFAGINNPSTAATGGPSLENFISIVGNVTTETAYIMTLKGNTAGNFTNNFRVFIDWNKDGVFSAGETYNSGSILNSTGVDAVQAVTSITVPANALAGNTRMRVKKLFGTTSIDDPCLGGGYGQTEDYTINVTLCTPTNWYVDADGDGYGNTATLVSACNNPGGYVTVGGDCNDNDNSVYQSAPLYTDVDGDGYTVGAAVVTCYGATVPVGKTLTSLGPDCNDNNAAMHATYPFYVDADGDGFGTGSLVSVCALNASTPPTGYSLNNTDCDDNAASIYPGAPEVCYDGILQNCNGTLTSGCAPVIVNMISSYCNTVLPFIFSTVTAENPNLPSGTIENGYRFEITNLTSSDVRTLERPIRNFKLTMTDIFEYGTFYQVKVAIKVNEEWQPYGNSCIMATPNIPTTQIVQGQCGTTLPLIFSTVTCNSVNSANQYRFRVENAANTAEVEFIERSVQNFKMTQLTTYPVQYNTTYNVSVQVRVVIDGGEVWSNSGQICNITTPTFPTTQVQLSQCELMATSNTQVVSLDIFSGTSVYRVRLTNVGLGYSQTVDRTSPNFTLSMFTGLTAGATYTVAVSIKLGGVFGPYGKNCDITTPGGGRPMTKANDNDTKEFSVIAFPNPFATTFALDVKTSSATDVNVSVYDMTGRLLEVRTAKAEDLLDYNLGDRYPSGIYNIVVNQGMEVKTVRVVKQ